MTVPLTAIDKGARICVLDVETTGLNPKISEILQLAIVDGSDGSVILNKFYDSHYQSWPEAEAVNGISKGMVYGYPYFEDEADEVTDILATFDVIAGYNVSFDLQFLKAGGVKLPRVAVVDLMEDYTLYRKELVLKRFKLSEAASWAGHDMMKAHDAVYDSLATLAVFNKLKEVMQ